MVELEEGKEIVLFELEPEPEVDDTTAAESRGFIAAIQGQAEPLVTIEEALLVQRLLVGLYDSAATGEEVRL